jgi:hypothetical protein
MTLLGQKRTSHEVRVMSALPPESGHLRKGEDQLFLRSTRSADCRGSWQAIGPQRRFVAAADQIAGGIRQVVLDTIWDVFWIAVEIAR